MARTVRRTRTIFVRRAPLAQIFSFTQNRMLSAVGLQFTRRDTGIPVMVQIRGVPARLPNDSLLAEKGMTPSEVNLGAYAKAAFDDRFLRRSRHQLCRGAVDQQHQTIECSLRP